MDLPIEMSENLPKRRGLIPIRFLVSSMAVICPIICYMGRQNLNIAIIAMVPSNSSEAKTEAELTSPDSLTPRQAVLFNGNRTDTQLNTIVESGILDEQILIKRLDIKSASPSSYGPKYNWSESDRNYLIGAFFWSYVFLQIPGARVAELVGPVWVLLFITIGTSAMNLIAPLVASYSVYGFFVARLLLGVFQAALFPACYTVCTRWHPPSERRLVLACLNVSPYVGAALTSATTGYFINEQTMGWEYAFYMPAVMTSLWAGLWFLIGADEPNQHKLISTEELEYIDSNMEVKQGKINNNAPQIDWKKTFSSRQVLSNIVLQVSSGWSFTLVLQFIPSYLNYIIGVDSKENSSITTVCYVIFSITGTIIGITSAKMILFKDRLGLKTIQIRKLHQSVSIFGQTICFLLLTKISENNFTQYSENENAYYTKLAKWILFIQIFTYSFINACEVHIANEISFTFAGSIYAIANAIGSSTGFLVPSVKDMIIKDSMDKSSWDNFFYLAAAISLGGGLIFLIWGGNEPEDFTKATTQEHNARGCTIKRSCTEQDEISTEYLNSGKVYESSAKSTGDVSSSETDRLSSSRKVDYHSIHVNTKI